MPFLILKTWVKSVVCKEERLVLKNPPKKKKKKKLAVVKMKVYWWSHWGFFEVRTSFANCTLSWIRLRSMDLVVQNWSGRNLNMLWEGGGESVREAEGFCNSIDFNLWFGWPWENEEWKVCNLRNWDWENRNCQIVRL